MTEVMDIRVTKIKESKLKDITLENIPFGQYFSDHMLEATYKNGSWQSVEIKPYQPFVIEPSMAALHYGQAIFEGIKAYKNAAGDAFIFRPDKNFTRFNISATRMNMPEVPEEIFMDGMKELISLDRDWIPSQADHSLYIRPVMFSADNMLGVRPSDSYKFFILLSPTGPYYGKPMKIMVEEKYTRAAPGGVGYSKNAGNYGGSMLAASNARKLGFDQVLWTDAFEHKWLQEVGMMNVFFIIDNVVVTPSLEDGTILNGVTRESVITGFEEKGLKVEERKINIDEVIKAYDAGKLTEVFGTGTAAVISPISELNYKGLSMTFDSETFINAQEIKQWLADIRRGKVEDTHSWMVKV